MNFFGAFIIYCFTSAINIKLFIYWRSQNDEIPVYKTPSELLHGEVATNSGMVKGNFLGGSFNPPSKYKDPSLGSGSKTGIIASCVLAGTLTIGSKSYLLTNTYFRNNNYLLTIFDFPSYGTSLLLNSNQLPV